MEVAATSDYSFAAYVMHARMDVKSRKKIELLFDGTDEKKLLELAKLHKSKKHVYTFKDLILKLDDKGEDTMWKNLNQMIMKNSRNISEKNHDFNSHSSKKAYTEVYRVIQAVIDLAQVVLSEGRPLGRDFLNILLYLNGILLNIPSLLDNIKNNIASVCEKIHLNYTDMAEELTFNAVVYLLNKSTSPKATKEEIIRLAALHTIIPKIIKQKLVNPNEIWNLLKKCAASRLYSTILEGQKIITLALITDIGRVSEVHDVIKKQLFTCSLNRAASYGEAYFEAWSHTFKTGDLIYRNKIELSCIYNLILAGIEEKSKTILPRVQKVLAQFHCKKEEIHVRRMLYSFYQPTLWLYLRNPDGVIRANSAKLFFDAFPVVDPDSDIVSTHLALDEQMLMIKELLVDEYYSVRCSAIKGLCLAMCVNWELFSDEILKTFFKILTEDLSCDSSLKVRCAVAKGFKVLLMNPLIVPTLKSVLPNLKNLFDDKSNHVRIAFCLLLLSVKKVWGIKYNDIVPLEHLLARMKEDHAVSKLIVNLIHDSYFPKNEHPETWLIRCIEMIKTNKESSREFFRHIPHYLHIDSTAKFMIQAVKAIHFYISKKSAKSILQRKYSAKKSNQKKRKLNDSGDVEALETVGFHDPNLVMGLFDAVVILYFFSNLTKPEHKSHLNMVVGNLSKWMEDLIRFYKDSPVWSSVFYLASLLPSEHVPSLHKLCHKRLTDGNHLDDQERSTILQCLCYQRKGGKLLLTLKNQINTEFAVQIHMPKRRKLVKSGFINQSASLALKMLMELLNNKPCLKILLIQNRKDLKAFLDLLEGLKMKIESLQEMNFNEEDTHFISNLFLVLIKIAVFLQDENCNGLEQVEDSVTWIEEKLFKIIKQPENALPSVTQRNTISNQSKCSADFKKLVMDISREMCVILADIDGLKFFNQKKSKFVKFGIQLLNLDSGVSSLLPVSRLLLVYIRSGALLYLTKEQKNAFQIALDCKIQFCLDAKIKSTLPSDILENILQNLTKSMKLLKKINGSSFRLSCAVPLLTA